MMKKTLEVDLYFNKISHFSQTFYIYMDLVEDYLGHFTYFVTKLLVKVSFIDCVDVQNVTCKWRKYMQVIFTANASHVPLMLGRYS